jgi:hypothetical protein
LKKKKKGRRKEGTEGGREERRKETCKNFVKVKAASLFCDFLYQIEFPTFDEVITHA